MLILDVVLPVVALEVVVLVLVVLGDVVTFIVTVVIVGFLALKSTPYLSRTPRAEWQRHSIGITLF